MPPHHLARQLVPPNLLFMHPIQAKMVLGGANDRHEQEADRIAKQVVAQQHLAFPARSQATPDQPARRGTSSGAMPSRHPEIDPIQRQVTSPVEQASTGVSSAVEASIHRSRGGGQALPEGLRGSMEQAFSTDFSNVRVHSDDWADRLNRATQARAFTTGTDIFFRQGEYNPNNRSGQELLAHELTHVVQQSNGNAQQAIGTSETGLIQRALSSDRIARLNTLLGRNKTRIVRRANFLEAFDTVSDDALRQMRTQRNDQFTEFVQNLGESDSDEGLVANFLEWIDTPTQIVELAGTLLVTGEEASLLAPSLGVGVAALQHHETLDASLETFSSAASGAKDAYEGGFVTVYEQKKYVEGGLLTTSGVAGFLSALFDVPDFVGVYSGVAKTGAGVTKMANTKWNKNALTQLKTDSAGNTEILAAIEVLEDENGYLEGFEEIILGGAEAVSNFMGEPYRWGLNVGSKMFGLFKPKITYLGRAALSTVTSRVYSNAQLRAEAEQETATKTAQMRIAVATATPLNANLIGRLHRLAVLINPELASAMKSEIERLPEPLKTTIKQAIEANAVWNP